MALQGSLQDMAVADLIQHNCADRKTARLIIEHDSQQATLFFKDGSVTDATLGDLRGEKVIYQLLRWREGLFTLEIGPESPEVTINRNWSNLLLEGARLLDEGADWSNINGASLNLDFLSSVESQTEDNQKIFAEILTGLTEGGSDLEGVAVVSTDGVVYAASMPQHTSKEENYVGTISAAALGLSKRSVDQLKRGNFKQTFIQADQGNIIISSLSDGFILIGLAPQGVNLGIIFFEIRAITEKLQEFL